LREDIDYYCVRNTRTFMRALNVKRERERGFEEEISERKKSLREDIFLKRRHIS
jgi:hypothetical protein